MNPNRWWLPFALFGAVIAAAVLGGLVFQAWGNAARPDPAQPGWHIIRPPIEVSALAIQDDVLWAGGRDGVTPIDLAAGTAGELLECDLPLVYVQALLVDDNGVLWIGHQAGLSHYDGQSCVTLDIADGLPDLRVNALYQDRTGRLWVGTWGGAAVRMGESWQIITAADGLAHDMVNVILEDSQGGMWFGSYVAPQGGVSVCTDGDCLTFSVQDGLQHNNISSIIEDDQGFVWVGTGLYNFGGAARFARLGDGWEIVETLEKSDGLAGEKVRSIFQDRYGSLWFGSEYDGLARLDASGWQILTPEDGLSNPEIKIMLQDANGNLWIGTRDGITWLSVEALQALSP